MEAVKVKHTPGPWVMKHNWSGSYEIDSDTGKRIAHVDIVIPSTSTVSEHIEQGNEIAANAQLITAAPDMLLALKNANQNYNHFYGISDADEGGDSYHDEIRAAIAKAEGRTA